MNRYFRIDVAGAFLLGELTPSGVLMPQDFKEISFMIQHGNMMVIRSFPSQEALHNAPPIGVQEEKSD